MTLPELALKRPVTMAMIVVTMIGLGIIAGVRIPLEFLPPIEFPFIICNIPYVGATPEQVEKEVAIPAEGEFRTLSALRRIVTSSDMNGCTIRLIFDLDTNMTAATAEVRDRMERLKLDLPAEIDRIFLRKFSSESLPIMALALYSPGDDEELTYQARTILQPRLMRVEGVADVTIFGKPEREVLIEFDQQALRSRNLSLFQIVSTLQNVSFSMSAGDILDGQLRYFVRVQGEFTTPDELGELIVGPNAVRLRDVANVGYRTRQAESGYAIDGQQGTFILVRKESEANTISTCRAVAAELDALPQDPLFADCRVLMFFNQSETILSALEGLVMSGTFGGTLAVVILFFFLLRVRPTLVVALSIPASVVCALVFMFFSGMTMNIVTMISLIIALGMLVDNSIVVIENIMRYGQLGYEPRQAALLGATEVGMAITASTMTTLVVFIPIVFMQAGEMSTYMRQFAAPVAVSLIASLAIALTIIPLAASRMKPRTQARGGKRIGLPGYAEGANAFGFLARLPFIPRVHPIRHAIRLYESILGWTQRWRLATMLIILATCGVTVFPFLDLQRQGQPSVDTRRIEVDVEFDQGYDLTRAEETMALIEETIEPQREELGIKNVFSRYDVSGGEVDIYLVTSDELGPDEEYPYTTDQVMDIVWQRMPSRLPGAELHFSIAEASELSGRQFSLQLCGDDAATLSEYADRLKTIMQASIPQISEVLIDLAKEKQEVQLNVNETLAQVHGVSPLAIARTVDFALRGVRISNLKQAGREIPVWAQFQEEDRKSRGNLENVTVFGATGEAVPIDRVVEFDKADSPRSIKRVNGKNVTTLTAKIKGENLGAVVTSLKQILNNFELPRGYSIEFGDELTNLEENMVSFTTSLMLAVVLIFLVMGALFESYLLPLSVLSTLPLAGIGVVWALYLSGSPVDIVTMIGIILLAGVIVNNGIVLVDYINITRHRGLNRYEAILHAGRDRFRPVMMTALTTILGCVPLAVGGSVGAEVSFDGLGRALIGGLVVGTLLTLFIVPLFYSLIDDFQVWTVEFFSNVARILPTKPAKSIPTK